MSEATPATAPTSAEELRAAILERYDSLSKRLQQIARYVLDEPNEMALETLAVISERCGVQPSAIVRFAKTFGYPGASQMQRLFRDGLLSGHAALGYGERVRHFNEAVAKKPEAAPTCWPSSSRATPWPCRTWPRRSAKPTWPRP
jgi:DNA-binding MurR/RpiR family transcriptional regulator